ncbi:MAG: DegT/DnrJ/EryC1/StrS family aminotransferase, partial [Proteobacteria bacterium]|nr:DegT/DnrJ/EryC1/StrS family aminotransferase [Pseudomonadota bacterium]
VMFAGAKSNLSDVAAQVGIDQLRRLDGFNRRRRELAELYFRELEGFSPVVLPARGDEGHSWHMFTLLIDFNAQRMTRVQFQKVMHERGIGIGIHYPSIPGFTCYRIMGYRPGDYPNAARIGRETVTLPLFPAMEDADVSRVCRAMRDVLREVPARTG